MAFWKMMMSLTLSAISTHAAVIVRRQIAWRQRSRNSSEVLPGKDAESLARNSSTSREESEPMVLESLQQTSADMESNAATVGGGGSSADKLLDKPPKNTETSRVWGWTTLYAIGIITGYCGLFSLVRQSWHIPAVRDLTYSYIAITVVSTVLGMWAADGSEVLIVGFGFFVMGTGMIAALYSDWILAAIDGNYAGVPDGNNALLYWTYFAAKRLPFACF